MNETMEATHTPTPVYTHYCGRIGVMVDTCHDRHVAICETGDERMDELHAKRLATCSNAHAALVEALRDVRKRIEASDQWWMGSKDRGGFDVDMIDKALAAINADKPDHA